MNKIFWRVIQVLESHSDLSLLWLGIPLYEYSIICIHSQLLMNILNVSNVWFSWIKLLNIFSCALLAIWRSFLVSVQGVCPFKKVPSLLLIVSSLPVNTWFLLLFSTSRLFFFFNFAQSIVVIYVKVGLIKLIQLFWNLIIVNFCTWFKVWVQVCFFLQNLYLLFQHDFLKRLSFSPLKYFGTFVKKQLSICVSCFGTLCSAPLINLYLHQDHTV